MVPFGMAKKPTDTIAISEFKATCLAVLERVRRTGAPIIVTRRGEPIAEVIPPSIASAGDGWLGAMRGTAVIVGDLVSPASASADWEALGS
jgi:prevent-host-death family protein